MFGGALMAGLSQTIFNEQLVKQMMRNVPDVDIAALLAAGTIGFHKVITPAQLPGALQSYNSAILNTFYLAAGATALSVLVALGLPWLNIKGKSVSTGDA